MISSHQHSSAASVVDYHEKAFDRDLAKSTAEGLAHETTPASWGGLALAEAGLRIGDPLQREIFSAILEGHIPTRDGGTEHLGRFVKNEQDETTWTHKPGMVFVVSPPKSVSIMAGPGGDIRLSAAHQVAVARTMAYLELHAAFAKVSENGVKFDRPTGNLLYASIEHYTNRTAEPLTHTHVEIMNATFDRASGQWRSLNNNQLLKLRTTADQVYRSLKMFFQYLFSWTAIIAGTWFYDLAGLLITTLIAGFFIRRKRWQSVARYVPIAFFALITMAWAETVASIQDWLREATGIDIPLNPEYVGYAGFAALLFVALYKDLIQILVLPKKKDDQDARRFPPPAWVERAPRVEVEVEDVAERTYLAVPYAEKNAAKAVGAKWDPKVCKWYVPGGVGLAAFGKWLPVEDEAAVVDAEVEEEVMA